MKNGNKARSENLLIKSFKELAWSTFKEPKKIFKLSVASSVPIFKLRISTNKKVKKSKRKIWIIPVFIVKSQSWISLGLRFILKQIDKESTESYPTKLAWEIIRNFKDPTKIDQTLLDIYTQVVDNKKYFKNFRWSASKKDKILK